MLKPQPQQAGPLLSKVSILLSNSSWKG